MDWPQDNGARKCNLPLQGNLRRTKHNTKQASEYYPNPLMKYVPPQHEQMDLPRQMRDSPYLPHPELVRNCPLQLPGQEKCFESITNCAATEISGGSETDKQQDIICEQLFRDQWAAETKNMRKDGPTEATFQPEELKRHLCESRENEMKQAIRKQLRSMGAKTAGQITLTTRSPTRYEKILDDYFRTRAKAQLPRKISLEQIPNYKVRYSTEEQKKQTAPLSCKKQGKENQQINVGLMQKTFELGSMCRTKLFQGPEQAKHPPRRFGHTRIKTEGTEDTNRGSSNRWMSLTFSQRQDRILMNKRSKQQLGRQSNEAKQIQGCTFKPVMTMFKPCSATPAGKTTYAKMYLDRILKRVR